MVYFVGIRVIKAFDTVNQNILIEKLGSYGIRPVTNDCNRYEFVTLGQTESELCQPLSS